MADDALRFLNKGLSGRSQKGEVVLGQTNGTPLDRSRESFPDFAAKGRVGIDADALSAQVRHGPFGWTTAT